MITEHRYRVLNMSLTLPKPAGLLRSRLGRALENLVPESERDEVIVVVVRALEELGLSIEGNGMLDDDEPLASAFRQEGLDNEGIPLDPPEQISELFLDASEVGDLPSLWEGDTDSLND